MPRGSGVVHEDVDSVEPRDGGMDLDKGQTLVHDSIVEQTLTSERAKDSRVQHSSRQTPASGATNSRKWWQVAGV
jgi:hypothetical protein